MSDVQSRPSGPRGRGSARGGRGGYSSRGGRGGNRTSSKTDSPDTTQEPSYEDEGDLGLLKKKYSSSVPMLKELFPDWTDEDIVFALEDAQGDLENAIERITEGNVSQWGEVKKKSNDRSKSKAKEAPGATTESTSATRGGRGRGGFEGRGRGRGGSERGRGGRGGRGAKAVSQTNGTRAEKTSVPTTDVWDTSAPAAAETAATQQPTNGDSVTPDAAKEAPKETPQPTVAAEPAKKGWASLFAKPAPAPPQKKPPPQAPAAEKPAPVAEEKPAEPEPTPAAVEEQQPTEPATETPEAPPAEVPSSPPKAELTEINLEQVPDASHPPPTATAASTLASTPDPNSVLSAATSQAARTGASGYAATAYKATATGRGSGFQRRVLEQQEAVVMPGNHAVDRAAVQFGSMGLNGSAADLDIDEEREEPETRAQPPQHSPVAPRASLPPSTQAQTPVDAAPVTARPAPGLPPAPQAPADTTFNEFGRYGDTPKAYDPFTQPVSQPQPQPQEPFSTQAPIQPAATSGSDYSPFYAADQQRNPYNYYASYAQSQDAITAQQRIGSGFGVTGAEIQPQTATTQPPTRYGQAEAPNSGHNTPNPTLPGQTTQPSQQMPQGQGAHAGYGYGYPYYSNPHYASYMNQMNQQHQYGRNRPMYDDARRYDDHYLPHNNQFGYGNQYGPYGKGGMYGQPQHGFGFEHSSSPANAGSFNQAVPGRDNVYGRTGSAQPTESQQPTGSTAFGGMPDVFGRTQSGFAPNQPISQQQPVTSEETAKGFDAAKTGGPSPSLAQANRPGSATNSAGGQPQAGPGGLPPVQGQQNQQVFGGYPHLHPQYGGGLGGLGGHHQGAATQSHHQNSGYGNYGGAGFGSNYYGNTGRGGWGGNYGH